MSAIQEWNHNGLKAVIRVDEPAAIKYKVFMKGFDDFVQTLMSHAYADSCKTGVSKLHLMGFKGFENQTV